MAQHDLKPFELTDWGRHHSLIITASLQPPEKSSIRQQAVESVAIVHKINLSNVISLTYDTLLKDRGETNAKREVRVGPSAFSQNVAWLANVVLHEAIHADQFRYYSDKNASEKIRKAKRILQKQIVALDEFEAYYFCWRHEKTLNLSENQTLYLLKQIRLAAVDIDDANLNGLAKKGKFAEARKLLLDAL